MKLTILGGGGFRVPQVFAALAAADAAVRVDRLTLCDNDPARLAAIKAVTDQLAEQTPNPPRTHATTDLDEAIAGADFVFSAIRVGGTRGRTIDEHVALDLGVLGQETTGAGGIAYALRTVPVMLKLAQRVRDLAPQAYVINFTNPAGIVTEALAPILGDRVIGICDTPIGLLRRAAEALPSGEPIDDFDYVGLNHAGWLRALRVGGRDMMGQLLADDGALHRIEEARLMGPDWVRALGALPNEYLYYYYFTREAVASIRGADATRGDYLERQQDTFYRAAGNEPGRSLAEWRGTLAEREATYMAEARPPDEAERDPHEAEGGYQRVALQLMAALANGEPATLILNVRNRGTVPGLPDDAVVEVPCRVDDQGVRPLPLAPVRGDMLALLQSIKAVEQLTIAAVTERSAELAWKAFALHPLVDSAAIARELLARYRSAHPLIDEALTR